MEIQNNPVGAGGPDPIDLTRANRDAIRERTPVPPVQPKPQAADEYVPADPKRIANARDAFEHAASVQQRVADARDRFQVHKRVSEARARNPHETAGEDQITLSPSGQGLADTTIQPGPSDVDAAARAQRINDLRSQYESGQLDVASMVAESAVRMLGGE